MSEGLEGVDRLEPKDDAVFAYTVRLASLHLRAAALFAAEGHRREGIAVPMANPMAEPVFVEHQSYVVGSIFASVAYVEALINEVFASAYKGGELVAGLSKPELKSLDTWWQQTKTVNGNAVYVNQGCGMLQKYSKALTLAGKQNFMGQTPLIPEYKRMDVLRLLRNDLVHHKAEEVLATIGYVHRSDVEAELQTAQVAHDPLLGYAASNAPYPTKYFSYSCARWAIMTSMDFARVFFERLTISQ